MNYSEVERLLKRDAPAVFDFYLKYVDKPDKSKNVVSRFLTFIKNIIVTFLRLLSPIRRLFYVFAFFLFVMAYLEGNWNYAIYSFIMLNILLAFELADKLTAKDELAIAAKIQNSLIPSKPPGHNSYDIACYTVAAREVGGDYYDFITQNGNNKNIHVVIGDISGKGMGAALHMVQVRVMLHSILKNYDSLKNSLIQLNSELHSIFQKKYFLTMGIIRIEEDNSICYSRAGHTPLLHFTAKENEIIKHTPSGIGIGITNNSIFEKHIEEIIIETNPNDVIVLFTDGITEAMNKRYEQFDESRLNIIIKNNADKPVEIIKDRILHAVAQFSGNPTPDDDLSLIVMKRK